MSLTLRSLALFIEIPAGTTIGGNTATATALANAATPAIDVTGSLATATAEAFFGTQEVGVTIHGSLATATALANAGSTQENDYIIGTYNFFQIRTLPTRT